MIKHLADRLFKWFCHPDFYGDISGDLEELYQRNLEESRFPQLRYLLQVIGLFRPSLIRPFSQKLKINTIMLNNYFKISVRNLIRQRLFTTINVVGLAFGLAAFLLINEYVRFEKSYDGFFKQSDQLYRLSTLSVVNGQIETKDAMMTHPAAMNMSKEMPEILNYTNSWKLGEVVFRKDQSVVYEEVVSADSNFLHLFTYEVLQGDRETMLKQPNSLVFTKTKAREYFGDTDPVGQTVEVLGSYNRSFEVTGVIEDVPENTHYKFDVLMSEGSLVHRRDYMEWNWNNNYTFLLLDKNTNMSALREKIDAFCKKTYGEETTEFYDVHPIQDIHLKSDFTYEPEINGSEKAVSFLTVISIFILIIAWVNYINLATARAADRAKEVGLRKVIGAFKAQLVWQFLFESMLVNLLAALFAIGIAELFLPYFNALVGKQIAFHVWESQPFLINLTIFFFIGSFLAGFYPSLVLSGFKPVVVLKGKFRSSKKGATLRKGLVIFQFAASITLIAGTLVVFQQINYMQGKDLGISTDYVVGITIPRVEQDRREEHRSKIGAFKDELRQHNSVLGVGSTSDLPGGGSSDISSTTTSVGIVGHSDQKRGTTYLQSIDDNFIPTLNMTIVAGKNFDRNRASDSVAVMVNEAFLRKLNIPNAEDVVDELVQFGDSDDEPQTFYLLGVLKDFNRTSLKTEVEPTVYWPALNPYTIVVKLNEGDYQTGLQFIDDTWGKFFADSPLEYTFLDQRFQDLYDQDRRFGDVSRAFSIMAILIAMLGLFGLSAFMSVQRTKEVGVRKVLGAGLINIILIFYKEFLKLLAVAAIIGTPLTYYAMNSWLGNYAHRIAFPWYLIALATVVVVLFALVTVGYQTYKVAILKPTKTLQYE